VALKLFFPFYEKYFTLKKSEFGWIASYLKGLPGPSDEGFRVFRLHMFCQEEVPVDLVHVVVGLGEIRIHGVDRLLAIVRKQRRDLGKIFVVISGIVPCSGGFTVS
jgi:hypothetical protein